MVEDREISRKGRHLDCPASTSNSRLRQQGVVMSTKKCNTCGNIKSVTEFYKRSDSPGTRSKCKVCCNEQSSINFTKKPPEYQVWVDMNHRCRNSEYAGWHNYGGRGISVCEEWRKSFDIFLSDMGSRPTPKHQIDRVNNNGNYESLNCRWVLPAENLQNTRRTKLTKRDVVDIRSIQSNAKATDLAVEYNVSASHIRQIWNHSKWKNI